MVESHGRTVGSVSAIFYKNTNFSQAIANQAEKPFVECASQCLNHAAKEILEPKRTTIGDVQRLMIKLSTLSLAAELQTDTSLTPLLSIII